MKLKIGDKVKVSEGSGLDSGRIGFIVPFNKKYLEDGRYWDFDPKKESMIMDVNGYSYFTMFKNRLIKL